MVLLLAAAGSFFGLTAATLAVVAGVVLLSAGARMPPGWVLRMHRARPIHPREAPDLHRLVRRLAERSDLSAPPALFLVPSPVMNAFAVGNAKRSAIGLTEGLLRRLDRRELAGVLAHEISHVAHRDLWVMGLADMITRMTHTLSLAGQLMLFLALPLVLLGEYRVPWIALLLLIAAPTASALLQLALSRTRELDADLAAAELTGDPRGLASALARLEYQDGGWLRRLLLPMRRPATSPLLRSHPATAERIERLRSLAAGPPLRTASGPLPTFPDAGDLRPAAPRRVRVVRVPRWHPGPLSPHVHG
jgi:heat shock protein HtpX